jgi:hypothetical protein
MELGNLTMNRRARYPRPVPRHAAVTISVLVALTWSSRALCGEIAVTDHSGAKHTLSGCAEDRYFYRSGTPWSGSIALDPAYEGRISQLKAFVALNFHTPKDQERITQAALSRGMRSYAKDEGYANVILMVPMSSIDVITLGDRKGENNSQQTSSVKVAGRRAFDAGAGYAELRCKENLGPLGQADFSAALEGLKEIRAVGEPTVFRPDLTVFGTDAVPFKATVTDTAGQAIVFEKAMFVQMEAVSRSRYPYIGTTGYEAVAMSSDLALTRSGTSRLTLSSAKLRRVEVGKYSAAFDVKATLRSGEAFDLAITPNDDRRPGILGATPDGWVWVPWHAVSFVEFLD